MDDFIVLGLNQSATIDQIKKAYRKLSLVWHPDKNTSVPREQAIKNFDRITNAYKNLLEKFGNGNDFQTFEEKYGFAVSENEGILQNLFNKQVQYKDFDLVFKHPIQYGGKGRAKNYKDIFKSVDPVLFDHQKVGNAAFGKTSKTWTKEKQFNEQGNIELWQTTWTLQPDGSTKSESNVLISK